MYFSKIYQFLVIFFIIYGPLLDTSLGPISDLSFVSSLFVVLYGVLYFRNTFHDSFIVQLSILLVLIFLLTLINTLFLDIDNVEHSMRALLRPVRVFITLLSLAVISNYIVFKYGVRSLKILVIFIFISIFLHATIMIFQFFNFSFREYIYQFTTAKYVIEIYQATRMAGLTSAGGAQLSIIQSLGLVLGVYLFFNTSAFKYKFFIILSCQFILVSIILSGRSGLITAFLICPLYAFYLAVSSKFKNQIKTFFSILTCLLIFYFSTSIFIYEMLKENPAFISVYERIFDSFINYKETGQIKVNTLTALSNMFVLPEYPLHLLFGKSSYLNNNTLYDINTDIGYFRLIWGYGIVGSIFHYLFYIICILIVYNFKHISNSDKSLPIILLLIILFFHTKEILVFSRLSFQISFMILFLAYFLNSYKRNNC